MGSLTPSVTAVRSSRAMSYATADSQKEEFRKYLEKNGVISQLSRVLVGLYEEPERPVNAVEYIKKYLGAPQGVDIEELREESAEHLRVNQDLKAQVDALKTKLQSIED